MDNNEYNELQKLQNVEFEMLLEFRKICQKYNLKYFLSEGTLLGAVRHQGFIPWDDDIDVSMPREDYQKFIEIAQNELPYGMKFRYALTDSEYHIPWARIENEKVKVLEHVYSTPKLGSAWIDIFPLDGMPNSRLLSSVRKVKLLWRRVTLGWANYENNQDAKPGRPWYEIVLLFIGKTLKPGRFMSLRNQYKRLEDELKKYSANESAYYINFNGDYRFNSIMEKNKYYGAGKEYLFNGELFNGPSNYDAYLSKIYGDYMTLPPIEKRNKHHTTIVKEKTL